MNMDRGRKNMNGPGPVPERWLKCPRKSASLLNGKFLIFKTPLNSRFDSQIPEQYRFPVSFVFQSMKSYKVKVGLWIDLTNTTRFYDKTEVEENDCRYQKLKCKGRGETPTVEQANSFAELCDGFIRQNPLEVIGVHCTHGFNRSGFLIVSYLVTMLDWSVEAALFEFAKARPPGIYKQDYIDELYKRFDDIEYVKPAPLLPEWCYEEEEGEDDVEETEERESGKRSADGFDNSPKKKKRREMVKKDPKFMEGVSNVEPLVNPFLLEIQNEVQALCGWESTGFPGSQPVSMTRENLKLLSEIPYRVSWKADGVRYLMYIRDRGQVYCIDRDNSVFRINNLTFPFRKNLQNHLKSTLLDGEMVIDKVNGVNVPRYLVYDIISFSSNSTINDPFYPTRYYVVKKDIIEPRNAAIGKGLIKKEREPFSVRLKEFLDVREAARYLSDKFKRTLTHEPDGLIFQPSQMPYKCGPCDELLKWKPPSLNSVDFRLKIGTESGIGIVTRKIGYLYVGGLENPFDKISPVGNIAHLNDKIIECTYRLNKWVFLRERTDKSFPNSYSTAKAVWDSIRFPVTEENLLEYIEMNRFRERMPPPQQLPPRYQHH